MAYTEEVRNEAFALYCQDKSYEEIGRILKINRNTISRWHKQGNWSPRYEKVKEKIKEKLGESVAEIRARQIKICKAAQADYVKKLKRIEGETSYTDADKAMKHELLLAGEPTERTEDNIVINIIKPTKHGDNNKLESKRKTRPSTNNTRG